ncbi:Uma2 family endonuclease [Pseudonocardiaceae bacterium YIM PH 21723]|nr:Uma2 family endonuclease [Pseudonocardiaceae bacterium YIM PH 21723]
MVAPVQTLVPAHDGPWTIDDVLRLPDDRGQRIELVDGALVVSPAGRMRHQRLVGKLFTQLSAAAPSDVEVTLDINVRLAEDRLLIPDLTIMRCPGADFLMVPAAELLMAVEVVSPSSRTYDRVTKRHLYAESGIPYYLLVDPTDAGLLLRAYQLVQGRYKELASGNDGILDLEQPFEVSLRLG